MTSPPAEGAPDVTEPDEALYRDLLYLHALAPEYRDLDLSALPGYGDFYADSALRHLADAPEGEVGVSARLAVLYDVARAHLHDHETLGDAYAVLAGSTLALKTGSEETGAEPTPQRHGPHRHIRAHRRPDPSADAGLPFATTPSAGAFEHQETAFIGQSVCTVRRVRVNGIAATWIFSEFETDAPLAGVADWLDPATGGSGATCSSGGWTSSARHRPRWASSHPRTATTTGRASSTRRSAWSSWSTPCCSATTGAAPARRR